MSERIPVIEAKNLVKTYGEGEGLMYALNDVSVTVYEHDFLVILGGSGSGKSTLLNMIGAIDKVDSGEIIVNNRDVVKLNDKGLTLYRRNEVGFVYQFFNLINDVTVYQNVTLAPGSRNKESNILLCDEPTGALDDVSGKAVLKLLEDIHNEGKTIVLVTHTKEIAQMANRIVTMKNGKVVSDKINPHIVKAEEVEW